MPRAPLVLLAAATAAGLAQGVSTVTLGPPVAEFPGGFTSLAYPRELPDGRVLVIEQCDRVVRILDFAAGTETQWSRTGSGPGEYRLALRLLPWPGDSTLVVDGGNRRLLVVDPAGRPGRMFSLPQPVTVTSPSATGVNAFVPTQADARGRLYARNSGLRVQGNEMIWPDSLAIERWNPATEGLDTVGFHWATTPGIRSGAGTTIPFSTGPQWAIGADGRLGVVDPRDYHAWFVTADGRRTVGPPVAFQAERLTEAYKALWRDEQKSACPPRTISATTADGRTINAVPRPTPEPTDWPDRMPPIRTGGVSFSPDGLLWVRLSTPRGQPHQYDLLDRSGRLTRRVLLPPRTRLLGFSVGAVYLVRLDDDDLEYLQRYRRP